jgi:predicted exporter
MILTCLVFLLVFRSLVALALALIPLFIGATVATAVSLVVFPTLHVVTLAFGSVLIGACTDYGIHYLAVLSLSAGRESRAATLKVIFPGLALGLLTTVLSYLALIATPLPGLVQLAVFSVVGLLASFATTVLVLPPLVPASFELPRSSPVLGFVRSWLSLMMSDRMSAHVARITALAIVALSLFAGSRIGVRDDIRLFAAPQKDLIDGELLVKRAYDGPEPLRYIVVEGANEPEVLDRTRRFVNDPEVTKSVKETCTLADWIPAVPEQDASAKAVTSIVASPLFSAYKTELGLPPNLSIPPAPGPLSAERFERGAARELTDEFWLGNTERGAAAVIRLRDINDEAAIEHATSRYAGIHYVNRAEFISALLGRYRSRALVLAAGSYALIAVILVARYGRRRGVICMIPPVMSLLVTLSMLAASGGSINVFTVFAILLTLGLGVDFAVFFLEGRGNETATLLAIVVSALTSAISTGLLATCSTPMLSQFGLAVSAGILASMVTAPLAAVLAKRDVPLASR